MWKIVEDKKTDKTRIEKTGREEEGNKKTDDR